ncbi:MAG TPA: type 1 glutamine amidotransferase [Bdellovibrionales bacterium]|nr:type 1 glutamine amidotransferase [Bdellovibrionales bacterium]
MRERRPLILVTGPDLGGAPAWWCTRGMIWLAGGRAKRVTPNRGEPPTAFDGLVLGGGADIHPDRYQEKPLPELKNEIKRVKFWRRLFSVKSFTAGLDIERDKLELTLLEMAVARGLPVLGLCRGEQLINVHFGGSLHQDVRHLYVEKPQLRTIRALKRIDIDPTSQLARAMGRTRARVNSLHRQAVNRLGAGLKVVAVEANGVVQAIEHARHPFVVGVQWHPEYLPFSRAGRGLFRALVRSAAAIPERTRSL